MSADYKAFRAERRQSNIKLSLWLGVILMSLVTVWQTPRLFARQDYREDVMDWTAYRYNMATRPNNMAPGLTSFIVNNQASLSQEGIDSLTRDGKKIRERIAGDNPLVSGDYYRKYEPGETRFALLNNRYLYLIHFTYIQGLQTSLGTFADNVVNHYGERPLFYNGNMTVDFLFLDLEKYHFERLQRPFGFSPDFESFNRDMGQFIPLCGLPGVLDPTTQSQMRSEISGKGWWAYVFCLFGLAFGLLNSGGNIYELWSLYRNFCRTAFPTVTNDQRAVEPSKYAPSFWTFWRCRDLDTLAVERYQLFRKLAAKETLVRRGKKPIRPNLNGRASASSSSNGSVKSVEAQVSLEEVAALEQRFLAMTNNGWDTDAERLWEKSQLTESIPEQLRLLLEAKRLQKRFNREMRRVQREVNSSSNDVNLSVNADQRPKREIIEELFPIPDFLPKGINPVLVREVLIIMAQRNWFGKNYGPRETIKRVVITKFRRLRIRFDADEYKEVMRWLVQQCVLAYFNKQPEDVHSIATNPADGKSKTAEQLIRLALNLRRWHASSRNPSYHFSSTV